MDVLAVFSLLLLLGFIPFVWWVWCLIQAMRVPDSDWVAADQNKLIYILLMIFLGVVGTIVYAVVARPALRRAGADL